MFQSEWSGLLMVSLVAGIAGVVLGVRTLGGARATTQWTRTTGKIKSANITEREDEDRRFLKIGDRYGRWTRSESEDGPYYDVEIQYSYTARGTPHTSNQLRFRPAWVTGPSGPSAVFLQQRKPAEQLVALYPVGRTVLVYYNPTNPEEAVLHPGGIGLAKTGIVVSAIFIIAPLFFIVPELIRYWTR